MHYFIFQFLRTPILSFSFWLCMGINFVGCGIRNKITHPFPLKTDDMHLVPSDHELKKIIHNRPRGYFRTFLLKLLQGDVEARQKINSNLKWTTPMILLIASLERVDYSFWYKKINTQECVKLMRFLLREGGEPRFV